ncbi:MAG: UDP-N-acetylmuramate--L-alanine ligase [Bacteroidales bacterium]
MRIHFIAIGGSAMHNLALALLAKGYRITGSDDEIFEPSRSRLLAAGLLPEAPGWFSEKITPDLDAVILGMHAKADNPELLRARELGLKIYSYPEYLYEQSKNKTRIVIGGSHGKTTITAMILHAMRFAGIDTDYMVGAKLEGFDVMVRLSHQAPYMVIEGDEYLTSPIDPRPKFHLYRPHIALISGIAWDHMNVFRTFEDYKKQFEIFAQLVEPGGKLVYCAQDTVVEDVAQKAPETIEKIPYRGLEPQLSDDGGTWVKYDEKLWPVSVFGSHNMQNMHGALLVCQQVGLSAETFLQSMATFRGAANRLELMASNGDSAVYRDFAHAPSKVRATTLALKEKFPQRQLIACLELHTYSSLNRDFLPQYRGTMAIADQRIVYYNPHAIELKRLPMLEPQEVQEAFGDPHLLIFNDTGKLRDYLFALHGNHSCLLLMSSGNFGNLDVQALARNFVGN